MTSTFAGASALARAAAVSVDLQRHHLAGTRRDGEGEGARPGSDVEHTLVAVQREEVLEVLLERRRPLGLERRPPVDLAHAAPTTTRWARGADESIPQASS